VNNFIDLGVDFMSFIRYTLRIESERRMTEEQQRKQENRLSRWNDSVRQVRELQRQWQRDNEAQFGPFLHPVEDEES
jgi:hypothetical protein